ncbi:MAG: signal recognition particle-docking protein FtsY [Bacteroidales bacterium]|nr:signal recognition particle-docking protein FtsY [Bacteroidales bacterium]
MSLFSFFRKSSEEQLEESLKNTRTSAFQKIWKVITGKRQVDDEFLDELEEALLKADVGVKTTVEILNLFEKQVKQQRYNSEQELISILEGVIINILQQNNNIVDVTDESKKPFVYMIVGVNGVGKTTTIGKMAAQLNRAGKKVMLGAADTFRAAAVDQLRIWAQRAGVDLHEKGMGADPAAVAYETLSIAKARNYDVVIIDTAGRLHNKINLMNELAKIRRVMTKIIEDAPHEVLLVLDATTGQNAFEQAKQFTEITKVTGLVLTKLDGTAKGGVVIGVSHEYKLPVKFIGVGEKIDDLQVFDANSFVKALLKNV